MFSKILIFWNQTLCLNQRLNKFDLILFFDYDFRMILFDMRDDVNCVYKNFSNEFVNLFNEFFVLNDSMKNHSDDSIKNHKNETFSTDDNHFLMKISLLQSIHPSKKILSNKLILTIFERSNLMNLRALSAKRLKI